MEAILFIILQIFYATRGILKLKNIAQTFPRFSWGIFTQSCDTSGPITYERKYLMDNIMSTHIKLT